MGNHIGTCEADRRAALWNSIFPIISQYKVKTIPAGVFYKAEVKKEFLIETGLGRQDS